MFYFFAFIFWSAYLFFSITLLTYMLKFEEHSRALLGFFLFTPLSMFIIPGFNFNDLVYSRWADYAWLALSICFAMYYFWQRDVVKNLKQEVCQIMATVIAFIGFAVISAALVEYHFFN